MIDSHVGLDPMRGLAALSGHDTQGRTSYGFIAQL